MTKPTGERVKPRTIKYWQNLRETIEHRLEVLERQKSALSIQWHECRAEIVKLINADMGPRKRPRRRIR